MKVFGHGTTSGLGNAINTRASFLELASLGVILLTEALDLCVGLEVNIELKNLPSEETYDPDQRIAELCVRVLEQRSNSDRVIISCFGLGCIDRVVEMRPHTPTALLLLSRRPPDAVLLADVHERHRAVHPYVSMVDQAFMTRARELGLRVNVWTAGQASADDVRALFDLGVDGLITESPLQAIQIRCRA